MVLRLEDCDIEGRFSLAVVLHEPVPPQLDANFNDWPGHRRGAINHRAQRGYVRIGHLGMIEQHLEHGRRQVDCRDPPAAYGRQILAGVETREHCRRRSVHPIWQDEGAARVDQRRAV